MTDLQEQENRLDAPWWCQLSHNNQGDALEDGMAVLQVSGGDRVEFLNGQLTNDVTLLSPDKTMLAGWCNNKGRLMMICQMVDWKDSIWLVMPSRIIESVAKKLQMYVMRSDVQLNIAEVTIIGLGDGADDETLDQGESGKNQVYSDDHGFIAKVAGDPTRAIYVIEGLVDVANEFVDEQPTDYFWLRGIQAGIPRILPETQAAFLAQWVNLDLLDGVSFKKGCYIGQEIVARTQNLGTVKRRLSIHDGVPSSTEPGAKVTDEQDETLGELVEAASIGETANFLTVSRIAEAKTDQKTDA